MKFPSLLDRTPPPVLYASEEIFESETFPSVRYVLHRMSAARRLDLLSRLGEAAGKLEMLRASEALDDRLQAEALRIRIDREYLLWGLTKVLGLEIDGEPAEAATLFDRGPEALTREILSRIRQESELSGEERKN